MAGWPGGRGEYRTFANGAIVYSNDYGAVYLTLPIFDGWMALQGQVNGAGQNLFTYLGLPTADAAPFAGGQQASFERGAIAARANGVAIPVYGKLYERYLTLSAALGLPRAVEQAAPGGGRFQPFDNGEIYHKDGLGAFGVSAGAIRDRWLALGGPGGALGYPMSDTSTINDSAGMAIGSTCRFQSGAIYGKAGGGAWDIRGEILTEYETRFGGPTGWLGFPIVGDSVAASGDHFNDFEGGVLVNHAASDPWKGVVPFQSLQFRLKRLLSGGSEGLCGSVDMYTYVRVDTPSGRAVDARWPPSGDCGSDGNADVVWTVAPVANSSITIHAETETWDDDDGLCFDDEHMGTARDDYSINNLWGLNSGLDHYACGDGCSHSYFGMDHAITHDPNDFRGQMWWSFHNFSTDELTYDQYAATFEDVTPDESWALHPFNHLFYEWPYKGSASNGNCFGMSLESIYAEKGRSPFSEPIHQYFPATQGGQRPTDLPPSPARDALINEINIRQGYQLGLDNVLWTLAMFAGGITHDPLVNYEMLGASSPGVGPIADSPLLMITKNYIFGGAHTVRPYKWESRPNSDCQYTTSVDGCRFIHIADSNYPTGLSAEDDIIEIGLDNSFKYREYSGGIAWGGRMMVMPFRNFNHTPVTPLSDPISAIEDLSMFIMGSDGRTNQITDSSGRTMFEPGLAAPPSRWDEIRHDDAARVPNLAPLIIDSGPLPMNGQVFVGRGHDTLTYEMVPAPSSAAGTPYKATFWSGKLAATLTVPGTPGRVDRITARGINQASRAISFAIPADGVSKTITWTLGGTNKHRWAELTGLTVAPGQELTAHLDNAGYNLVIDNDGPPTSATLRVKAGINNPPVVVGLIDIPSGTGEVEYELPVTAISIAGQVPGNQGWLLAPVTITLSAKDYSGLGIAAIETSRDKATWATYGGPFAYSYEGITLLYYRARDNALNEELPKSQEFKIDTRNPVVQVSTDYPAYTRTQPFTVHFSASDPAPGSGIETVTGSLDGTPVADGQSYDLLWSPLGNHVLTVTANDVAGRNTTNAASFQLIATLDSIQELIRKLRSIGEIDSDGVANSFLAKASRGNLNPLLHELDAQSGKHISRRAADLLRGDIQYVLTH